MKVRMLTLAASAEGVWRPGQVVTVPAAVGRMLLEGGYAEPVTIVRPEAATAEPPEKAVQPKAKTRTRGK